MIHIAIYIREDPRTKSNDSLAEMQVRSLPLFGSERRAWKVGKVGKVRTC